MKQERFAMFYQISLYLGPELSSCLDGRPCMLEQSWPKVGAAVPLAVRGAWSPYSTMPPGSRPTSVPSDILIHPTVWPLYINVTDRQSDRQVIGPIANGHPRTIQDTDVVTIVTK